MSRCFPSRKSTRRLFLLAAGWTDEDIVRKQVAELPDIVRQDEAYQNAMTNSDAQNARAESDRATKKAILATTQSGLELYKAVNANEGFRKWIMDLVFNATYTPPTKMKPKDESWPVDSLKVAESPTTYETGL